MKGLALTIMCILLIVTAGCERKNNKAKIIYPDADSSMASAINKRVSNMVDDSGPWIESLTLKNCEFPIPILRSFPDGRLEIANEIQIKKWFKECGEKNVVQMKAPHCYEWETQYLYYRHHEDYKEILNLQKEKARLQKENKRLRKTLEADEQYLKNLNEALHYFTRPGCPEKYPVPLCGKFEHE